MTAFLAISRYTGNLRLQIQGLKHEAALLKRDTASVFRQQKYAIKLLENRVIDLESKLEAEISFKPRRQVGYETNAPFLGISPSEDDE